MLTDIKGNKMVIIKGRRKKYGIEFERMCVQNIKDVDVSKI